MKQEQKHIELWYDATSDAENPAHIVSLEGLDSTTLAIFPPDTDGYTAALARARQESETRGLALVVNA